MLNGIWIENFKSYKTGQLLPLAPITLMIGANASGKSNAIEAFRFLSWFAGGEKLSTIKNRINSSEKIFRGSIYDLFSFKSNDIILGANFSDYFKNWEVTFNIYDGDLFVNNEKIISIDTNKPFFEINSKKEVNLPKDMLQEYQDKEKFLCINLKNFNSVKRGGLTCMYSLFDNQTSALEVTKNLLQLHMNNATKDNDRILISKILSNIINIQDNFENIKFLDLNPSKMRQESIPEKKLTYNGDNISGVLYTLWNHQELNYKDDILKFICSLPEQDFKELKFYKNHRDRVELVLVENFGGRQQEWGIELLSDGTLRVLGIAAAILSAPKGSTIVIEEIDNGIHPSRAKYLLDTMFYFAEKNDLKLLLSTHNPALMDALPDKALGDVVFAYRDPKEGDSRLIRLSDLDDYVGLVSQGPLGELVTQGIVDRFVKNPISKEDKKKKALSWLNEMRGASNE